MDRSIATRVSPSLAVVEMVAALEGVDPLDLECVLANAIDPVALERMLESADGMPNESIAVTFEYCSYTVTVSADGR